MTQRLATSWSLVLLEQVSRIKRCRIITGRKEEGDQLTFLATMQLAVTLLAFSAVAVLLSPLDARPLSATTVPRPWLYREPGGVSRVAVDSAGNVVASALIGRLPYPGSIIKLSGLSGELQWRFRKTGHFFDGFVLNSAQDVMAMGHLWSDSYPVVTRIAGSSGAEVWHAALDGRVPEDLAVDNADHVIVLTIGGGDIGVSKLSGATGHLLWSWSTTLPPYTYARALAVDNNGNAVVHWGGWLVKLAAASGAELWRKTVADDAHLNALIADTAGDIFAAGGLSLSSTTGSFGILKYSGVTGDEIWRRSISISKGPRTRNAWEWAEAVALSPDGEVVAGGLLGCSVEPHGCKGPVEDMGIAKVSAPTGTEIWRANLNGRRGARPGLEDQVRAIAIDPNGDVVVGGLLDNSRKFAGTGMEYSLEYAVAKLSGTTGREIWRRLLSPLRFQGTPGLDASSIAESVAILPDGDVVAGGFLHQDLAVARLSGLSGLLGPLSAKRLRLVDHPTDPTKRSILLKSIDSGTAPAGTAGDPTIHGAAVLLYNPITSESASFTLPAGSEYWKALGTPPGSVGFQYTDRRFTNGPCSSLIVKKGKRLSLACSAKKKPIPFSLDEPTQGELIVSVRLGDDAPQCFRLGEFAGTVIRDTGTSNPGPLGIFDVRDAPEPQIFPCPEP
jgi:outer membrane protein assembly factor BamB